MRERGETKTTTTMREMREKNDYDYKRDERER